MVESLGFGFFWGAASLVACGGCRYWGLGHSGRGGVIGSTIMMIEIHSLSIQAQGPPLFRVIWSPRKSSPSGAISRCRASILQSPESIALKVSNAAHPMTPADSEEL